jgi:hypothetical protein
MTNVGRLMPRSAIVNVHQSSDVPGLAPPATPASTPIAHASRIAANPSVALTGRPAPMMSFTVQLSCCRLGPKSNGRSCSPSAQLAPLTLPR